MEKRRLHRRCRDCGKTFEVARETDDYYNPHTGEGGPCRISWRTDPFAEDVRDDHRRHWLCDDCAYKSRMEI